MAGWVWGLCLHLKTLTVLRRCCSRKTTFGRRSDIMKLRLASALFAAAYLGGAAVLTADPVSDTSGVNTYQLASLTGSSVAHERPQMTIIPEGTLEKMLGLPNKKRKRMQFAGRCGSSNYYCDTPGSTYCCGNSTDGFYCAADVNGC